MHNRITSDDAIKPGRRRLAALVCICCTGLLTAAAPAEAVQMKDRTVTLEIKLAGAHKIKWQFADPAYPDPKRTWVQGSGEQTLSVSMPRPGAPPARSSPGGQAELTSFDRTMVVARDRSRWSQQTPADTRDVLKRRTGGDRE